MLKTKIAVLGIGNRLRGDDGAGSILAEKLKLAGIYAFDGATLPETYTGSIKKISPQTLIMIDVCAMGINPGEYRIIPLEQLSADDEFTSHAMSLVKLIDYLKGYIPEIIFIGIEPGSLEFGDILTFEVEKAVDDLFDIIKKNEYRLIKQVLPD